MSALIYRNCLSLWVVQLVSISITTNYGRYCMNLHQSELIVCVKAPDEKKLSITIQNCDRIREAQFKRHVDLLKKMINDSEEFILETSKRVKKRQKEHHISIVDA